MGNRDFGRGGGEGQTWTKKANFGCPVSLKIKNCLFLLKCLWWKFHQNWTVFEGVRTQELPKKSHFLDAELVRKPLNVMLIKLTRIIFIKSFTWQNFRVWLIGCQRAYAKSILEWAIKSAFWLNSYEHSDSSNNHNICYALPHIESLVKILYKLDLIWRNNPWKKITKVGQKKMLLALC